MASRGATGAGRRAPAAAGPSRPRSTRSQQLREAKNVAVVLPPEAKQESRKPPRPREGLARMAPPPAAPRKVVFSQPKMTKAMMARQALAQEKLQQEQRKQAALEAKKRGGRRSAPPRRSQSPQRTEAVAAAAAEILEESRHEARAGNAEVVQAVVVGDGDVGTIIIPPGVVNEEQTTIVQIVPPEEADAAAPAAMNRSLQAISQSLDEQEAAEIAAMTERLGEFQQARRGLLMELASVTAPGLDPDLDILDVDRLPLGDFDVPYEQPAPPRAPRKLVKIPDPDDEMFRLEYGRDHPAIIAAREFRQRSDARRRLEERFEQADLDGSFNGQYRSSTMRPTDIDELERFFNIQQYPPTPKGFKPPPGRERLHRDLWELEDPWYRDPPQLDLPDMMQFSP